MSLFEVTLLVLFQNHDINAVISTFPVFFQDPERAQAEKEAKEASAELLDPELVERRATMHKVKPKMALLW